LAASAHYVLVDVFAEGPFKGNPLAVFPDGAQVPEALRQTVARELNLSETTYVLPATDATHDFTVRIFTPAEELPFAGHPTLGTAYVLGKLGRIALTAGKGATRLGERVGPIPVRLEMQGDAAFAWMDQPLPRFDDPVVDRRGAAELLSLPTDAVRADLPIQSVSCGVPFLIVPISDLGAMRAMRPRQDLWSADLLGSGTAQVLAFTQETERPEADVHARMFAPWLGVVEDPATGSAAGPLGSYLVRHGAMVARGDGSFGILEEQGFEMGRPSLLHIVIGASDGDIHSVRVGGQCVWMGSGELSLP
jgi:trans-2,3-dihydro-3-hydroxyanthranilate isomerase